jgi:hypothetical protein
MNLLSSDQHVPVSGSTTRMSWQGLLKVCWAAWAARRIVSAGLPPRGAMMQGGSGLLGVATPQAFSMSINSCRQGTNLNCSEVGG